MHNELSPKTETDRDKTDEYSAFDHPNADQSVISFKKSDQKVKRSWFKGVVAWIDEHWLKVLLVRDNSEQSITAANEVDDFFQEIMEEEPADPDKSSNNQVLKGYDPMLRATLEKQRAFELN